MGKLTMGILGDVTNKIGPVVGFMWKGINVIRGYVVPSNPNTGDQQTQRTKFRYTQRMASAFLGGIIRPYWKQFAIQMSEFNAFISQNIGLINYGVISSYLNVLMSRGNLEGALLTGFEFDSPTLTVTWSTAITGNGLAGDLVVLCVYDVERNMAYIKDVGTLRSAGTTTMTLDAYLTEDNSLVYLFTKRPDGSGYFTFSNSNGALISFV